MAAIHYVEIIRPNERLKIPTCGIGIVADRNFKSTEVKSEVTCRSCARKLMNWTGDTSLLKQAFPGPYIEVA